MNAGTLLPGLAVPLVLLPLVLRARGRPRPLSPRRILIPPLGMSTGAGMFLIPAFRVPWSWAIVALATGAALLSIPLRRATRLTRHEGAILLPYSPALLGVLLGLVALRLAVRVYAGTVLPAGETAGLFFLLALGMIAAWRISVYRQYRAMVAAPAGDQLRR